MAHRSGFARREIKKIKLVKPTGATVGDVFMFDEESLDYKELKNWCDIPYPGRISGMYNEPPSFTEGVVYPLIFIGLPLALLFGFVMGALK